METAVQHFYNDKNIFLTGGSGFLGKAFIEKILRTTHVNSIYLLIRPKKNQAIEDRIIKIFQDPLFEELHKRKADSFKRITPIFGDCALPYLGLSDHDRKTLIENVDVVVHAAATVRFNEPLHNALAINVRATKDLIHLATKMLKLKAFVHVSSAFANCIEKHIDEEYYAHKIGNTAENLLKLADNLGAEIMNQRSEELCKSFPNTYTFTKALAEEVVMTDGKQLPICIFRPGIVVSTCNEPVRGWIGNFYGPFGSMYGMLYGVLRVTYIPKEGKAFVVPVDFCVNAMLACGWYTAESPEKMSPPIYNLVPDETNMIDWRACLNESKIHVNSAPLTNAMWYPIVMSTESKFIYKILCLLCHTIPGYIFDFFLLLFRKKRRMVKMYSQMHTQLDMLDYFKENVWIFTMKNTKLLWKSLSDEDQRLFNFDMTTIDWSQCIKDSVYGVRRYLAKEEPETLPKALIRQKLLLTAHRAVQCLVYGGGIALLFVAIYKLLP